MKKPISIVSNSNNNSELFLVSKIASEQENQSSWTEYEDAILLESLDKLKIRNKWKSVAKLLNRNVQDCINRFKVINPLFKRGHWTPEEDAQLNALVEIYGKNWAKISQIMKHRTGKQIRQRFLNFLDPKINKEKFTIDEDIKIFKLFKIFKTNWRYYTKYIPNRTADMIKGRYYSSVRFKENLLKLVDGLDEDFSMEAPKESVGKFSCAGGAYIGSGCIGDFRFNNAFNLINVNNNKNNKINFYYDINNEKHKESYNEVIIPEENDQSLWFSEKGKSEIAALEGSKFQSQNSEIHLNTATNCCNSLDCFSVCNSSDVEMCFNNKKNNQLKSKKASKEYNYSKFSSKNGNYSDNNNSKSNSSNSIIYTEFKEMNNEDTLTDYGNYLQEPKFSLSFEDEDIFASEPNLNNVCFMKF